MKSQYIHALEMRVRWLRWSEDEGKGAWDVISRYSPDYRSYTESLPAYRHALQCGDTFFMNKNFCQMIESARSSIPDDIQFEMSWIQAPQGWMWIETPFEVPNPEITIDELMSGDRLPKVAIKVSALGWFKLPDDKYYFLCYQDFEQYGSRTGFGCWSHFTLKQGDVLIDRIHEFENASVGKGAYAKGRTTDMRHEMRWVYAALYMMAQRIAHHSIEMTDRHTRRRNERARTPVTPFVKIVSLRRMEEDRPKTGDEANKVDWQWQWTVGGHWRLQPYKTLGDYKWIWIDTYLKGPEDKPLKPVTHKIFTAVR